MAIRNHLKIYIKVNKIEIKYFLLMIKSMQW